jgi:hypothetical protein
MEIRVCGSSTRSPAGKSRSTQPEIRIVTLRTSDGFHVSFGITPKELREMGEAGADRILH